MTQVFDELHFPESPACYLHCHNVWFQHQLPWRDSDAQQNQSCLFSVVQSSSGASPSEILKQVEQTIIAQ
jgi:hypothetical protein